jgi:SAM-dependent methyltransferase
VEGERLSFGNTADRYDRARPSYPTEAAVWLAGTTQARVLELGAGTGKLTAQLVALGHEVVATDPDDRMLRLLAARAPGAHVCTGSAERIPVASRSVDVVVAAQSFHWFDRTKALPEIARVLRPGGVLALVWNVRDQAIPWVRRLGKLIGPPERELDPVVLLGDDPHFGWVDDSSYRHWQTLDRDGLVDLVASRSTVATMDAEQRTTMLREVAEMYDGYGRGHDGMRLPYVTRCYRTTVQQQNPADEPGADDDTAEVTTKPEPPEDPGTLLIDFR